MSPRERLLAELAGRLPRASHPLRVGVDGITAAGKSTFAAELAVAVAAAGRPSRHLSTDEHHHRLARRRADPDRARGYYRDAYDLETFRRRVLDPLGPHGDRWVLPRRHDLASDGLLDGPVERIDPDCVVVVDGTFLQAPSLDGAWDVVVWLEVTFAVAVTRAVRRDASAIGTPDVVRAAYRDRYHAACRIYLTEREPRGSATHVVDNTDLAEPRLVR